MVNKAFLYAVIITGLFVQNGYANSISLSQSINRVLSVDFRNKLQQNNLESSNAGLAAVEESDGVKSTLNLKVGIDSNKKKSETYKASIDKSLILSKNIYDGGFAKSNLEKSKALVAMSKQDIKISQAEIVAEVTQLYIDILRLRRVKNSLMKNFISIKDLHKQYKRRVDLGVGKKIILLRLKQKVTMLEISIDELNSQLVNVEEKLKYLLQFDDNYVLNLRPVDKVDERVIEAIRESVEENDIDGLNHSKLLKIRDQIDVAGYDYDAKKKSASPIIDLQGIATARREVHNFDNGAEFGVFMNLTWNLSDASLKHNVKEKELALKNARVEYAFVRNKILSDLRMGFKTLNLATSKLKKVKQIYTEVMDIEKNSYEDFTTSSSKGQEYLVRADVINEFYTSQIKLIHSYYEKILVEYNLINTAGRILKHFDK